MNRPIVCLRLPERVRLKLQSMGFEYVEDIEQVLNDFDGLPPPFLRDIFEEHQISVKINAFKHFTAVNSAADLLLDSSPPIQVFHQGLARLLDGGLPVGQITELCGPPGSGKTQMCLQLCVDVQVPHELGGSEGEALYISTDFGFQIERLRQISQATINHFARVEHPGRNVKEKCLEKLAIDSLLNGIKVLRVHELKELQEALGSLKTFFGTSQRIKLLVVDSFSLPLIMDIEEPGSRTKAIAFILNALLDLAVEFKFAILLTNQLGTIMCGENKSIVKPALGQAHAHRIHQRLILNNNRIYLAKNIGKPQIFTGFNITTEGIR